MAKIKQMKMRLELNPARPWQETVVNINYDATDRNTENYRRPVPTERFYINFPKVVADALGIDKVRGKDQVEVVDRFKEALQKFKALETETNKVILYEFSVEPKPEEDKGKFFSGRYKVSIWAGTYEETVMTAGDGMKRYSYERLESDINFDSKEYGSHYGIGGRTDGRRSGCQVPWNEKNAAFFVWIKKNMQNLIERLFELEQPDNLIETVNAGRLLPLGEPPR